MNRGIYNLLHTKLKFSEIIRMFNNEFDSFLPEEKRGITFYPPNLAKEIDEINEWVYDTVNNGYAIRS